MDELPEVPDFPDFADLPEPAGPSPVVLLHGVGQMPTMWQSQVEALGAQTKAVAPWIDGLRPGRPREVSLPRAAAGLISSMELNGIKRARVVAHHFGAMAALQAAVDAPGRIERMVLSGVVALPGRLTLAAQKAVVKLMPPARLAEVGATKEDLLRALDVMAKADFMSRLGEITVPVLVICCEADPVGRAYAQTLERDLPGAELTLISGSGPAPMAASPEEYNQAMTEFLNRAESAG